MTHHVECVAILELPQRLPDLRVWVVCIMCGVGVTGDVLTLK